MRPIALVVAVLGCASTPMPQPGNGAGGLEPELAIRDRQERPCHAPYLTACIEECTDATLAGFAACRSACERQANQLCRP